MIDTRILEVDPLTGEIELMHYDDTDGSFTIETKQDVDGLIEIGQQVRHGQDASARYGDGMHHIGWVPLAVYFAEQKKGTWKDKKAFSKFVNDSNSPMVRSRQGRY